MPDPDNFDAERFDTERFELDGDDPYGSHRQAALKYLADQVIGTPAEGTFRPGLDDEDFTEPDFAPWDGRRVPVTLLGGYLGAGKTTVLNELLARTDQPIAVMVNEVGSVNIDASLIKSRSGDTIELTDGCICCDLKNGLSAAFDQLRAREAAPAHVIVELSGVAQPGRIIPWANSTGFRLDGVVVLIDSELLLEHLDHEWAGPAVRTQIDAADLMVLTKTDLVDDAQIRAVRRRLTELAPGIPVITSVQPMATAGMLGLGARLPGSFTELPPANLFDDHLVETIELPRPIARDDLQALINQLPADAFRAKGIALDPSGDLLLVQSVGRRCTITSLPEAELQFPTDLVVISTPPSRSGG